MLFREIDIYLIFSLSISSVRANASNFMHFAIALSILLSTWISILFSILLSIMRLTSTCVPKLELIFACIPDQSLLASSDSITCVLSCYPGIYVVSFTCVYEVYVVLTGYRLCKFSNNFYSISFFVWNNSIANSLC